MARVIQQGTEEEIILLKTKKRARDEYIHNMRRIKNIQMFAMIFMFISPLIGTVLFIHSFLIFADKIIRIYFKSRNYILQYNELLNPITADEVVSSIGYEIYGDELPEHLELVKNDSSDSKKALAKKQQWFENPINKHMEVGLSEKLTKTHLLLLGKTGAGKTECIRSIVDDVFKFGGGLIMVDGKADTNMLKAFQSQAMDNNRETGNYVINHNNPEQLGESNTMSILSMLHPVKIVEFLGSLARKGEGDANSEHFFNKGKAMLFPVVSALSLRDKTYKEGLNFDKLVEGTKPVSMAMFQIIFYCMLRDIEEKIKSSFELKSELDSVILMTTDDRLGYIEKAIEYGTQHPSKVKIFEDEIETSYTILKELYSNTYMLLKSYLGQVWNRYDIYLDLISRCIYQMGNSGGKSFYISEKESRNCYSLKDIKIFYNNLKLAIGSEDNAVIEKWYNENNVEKEQLVIPQDIATILKGLVTKNASVEDPPPDAIQQHAYAQQIWSQLFNTFTMYKHIFGQTKGEVQPEKILKDNKFLYTLLPPLQLQPTQVTILGKLQIMAIKEVASLALGGRYLSLHQTIANIHKDRYTPKPFTLVILDEYGAFPVDGIDVLLAQVRSLNMSIMISIQDMVSLKTDGNNDTAQKRAMANLTKLLFKIEDKDMIDWIKTMISKIEVEAPKFNYDVDGNFVLDTEFTTKEKEAFDPVLLRDFDKGFGVLQRGGGFTGSTFIQTFYRGGSSESMFVKKFIPYD